ncbi:MAG: hypothetical protein QUV04_08270 [Synechococcus sp. WH 8007]|nr:hypothetical protein [Synechococcus sp. WH 8007]
MLNSLPSSAAETSALPPQAAVVSPEQKDEDPALCGHCGRTANNGLVCIGMCVADSGY